MTAGHQQIQVRARAIVAWVVIVAALSASTASATSPPRFPPAAIWHQDIRSAAVHPDSAAMLGVLAGLGGWGNGNRLQIDFSLHVFHDAPLTTPQVDVIPHRASGQYYAPDCEALPTRMPVPATAAFEGQSGLRCDNTGDDCHLLVQQGSLLYELYSGDLVEGVIDARCLAVWNLQAVYPAAGRGDNCSSADAAGFPIAPLLVNADEVATAVAASPADSDLGHAIRFILPNARMARDAGVGGSNGRLYVLPASHAGGPTGPAGSIPYGARLRLRASFPMTGYSAPAQVILRTLQRYGMVLADGGNIALTFESDRHTTSSWAALGIGPHLFWNGTGGATRVEVADFEMIDTGPRIADAGNCVRTTVTADRIFANGFDA